MALPGDRGAGTGSQPFTPRWLGALDTFERRGLWNISTGLMLVAASVMLLEATARTLFSTSYPWAEEVVRYFVLWSIFLVFGLAPRRGHFIRTELVFDRCPLWLKRVLNVASCLGGLLFSAMLVWAGWVQTLHLRRLAMMSETMDLPLWIVKIGLLVGALLLFFYFVYCTVLVFKGRDPFQSARPENA
jgi:C4-dicarboxylate transporter DctQ subunit